MPPAGIHAAVDGHDRTSNVFRPGGAKVENRLGNLVDLAPPSPGDCFNEGGVELLIHSSRRRLEGPLWDLDLALVGCHSCFAGPPKLFWKRRFWWGELPGGGVFLSDIRNFTEGNP